MQTVTLNNGIEMPVLGFGVYQIPPEQTEQTVTEAVEERAAGRRPRQPRRRPTEGHHPR